jgi:hypothetical protein
MPPKKRKLHEKERTPCRPVVTGYGKQGGCAGNKIILNLTQLD